MLQISPSKARVLKEAFEAGDNEDVAGHRGDSQGFSRYAFHDIEPVIMTEAVVTVVTDSSTTPVTGFVQPQYLAIILGSALPKMINELMGRGDEADSLETK